MSVHAELEPTPPRSPRRARRVLIVGGVAGGASCAARLRRLDESVEIAIFDRGPYVAFANCGLPYYVGDVIADERALLVASREMFRERFNVDVHNNHVRWNRNKSWDDDWGREWDDDLNIGSQYGWSKDVEYIMTNDGLVRTDRRKVDNDERKEEKREEKKGTDEKNTEDDPGYRYHSPKSTRPAATGDSVKKTAALLPAGGHSRATDAHLYLLSALFQ